MLNIYQLGNDYLMLANRLADSVDEDGIVNPNLLPTVQEAKELVESKAVSIGGVIKTLRAYKAQIDAEKERLASVSKMLDNRIDYLEDATSAVLQQCGIERIEGVHAVISFRKSTETDPYDIAALPDEYKTVKTTVAPNKTKIREAIQSGAVIPGARLIEKKNIQIK